MPFCATYGTEINPAGNFCFGCGVSLSGRSQGRVPAAAPPARTSAFVVQSAKMARNFTDGELTLLLESRRKSGWVAAILNIVLPGAGYFYCGRWVLGLLAICYAGACILLSFVGQLVSLGIFEMIYPSLVLMFVVDGFICAHKHNKEVVEQVLRYNHALIS
jgi:hypothetical protein